MIAVILFRWKIYVFIISNLWLNFDFSNFQDQKLVEAITQRFNNELVFDPELNLMCYTLRDPVSAGTFPTAVEKKPRGKARRMEIKSRCFDACLVIDGSLSYKFNDGTRAIISIHDEDVLRTVHIYSSDIWKKESTWISFPVPNSFFEI